MCISHGFTQVFYELVGGKRVTAEKHCRVVSVGGLNEVFTVDQFNRCDPSNNSQILVQLCDVYGTGFDGYRQVDLIYRDGRHFVAVFWCDPMERGKSLWEETVLAIVPELTLQHILPMVDAAIKEGEIETLFTPAAEIMGPVRKCATYS